jgi:hypothetical protein
MEMEKKRREKEKKKKDGALCQGSASCVKIGKVEGGDVVREREEKEGGKGTEVRAISLWTCFMWASHTL